MEQGIYHNISSKEYHGEAMSHIVSNSYLGRLAKVPAYAKLPQEETEAMKFGRAFHCYVLEDRSIFWNEFVVPDYFPTKPNSRSTQKTKDAYAKWISDLGKLQPITQDELDKIVFMNNSVHTHPFASKLLADGISETTIIWDDIDTGLKCKVRPDRIPSGNKGVILDLKSTANASTFAFRNDCVKFGYAREAGMYLEGFARVNNAKFQDLIFAFIAVEKTPPYRCEVYSLEIDFVQWGWLEYHRLLQIEKECREKNFWPHYINAGCEELTKPPYVSMWEWDGADRLEEQL
jgi:exodeoxyribonuclease VIII